MTTEVMPLTHLTPAMTDDVYCGNVVPTLRKFDGLGRGTYVLGISVIPTVFTRSDLPTYRFIQDDLPWFDGWYQRPTTPTRSLVYTGHRCKYCYSTTVDDLERPVGDVSVFTAELAEWLNSRELLEPPMLIVKGVEKRTPRHGSLHAGLSLVGWMQDFFGLAQEATLRACGIAPATYYLWKRQPSSLVRPATLATPLRLRAAIDLLQRRHGRMDAQALLTSGDPSVLDRLVLGKARDAAIDAILEMADIPQAEARPRTRDRDRLLRAIEDTDPARTTIGVGARRATDEQVRELDSREGGMRPSRPK